MNQTRAGVVALVASGFCLGFSPVLVRASDSEPITVAALRAGLAALMLAPVVLLELRRRGRPPRRQVAFAAAAGILLGADYSCWNISVLEAGGGIATVLINVQVVLMPLLLLAVERIRLPGSTWALAGLMLLGVGLAGGLGSPDAGTSPAPRGVLLGVLAGAGYTGYLYLVRRGTLNQNHWPITVLAVACTSASGTATAVGAGTGVLELPDTSRSWLLIALLAFVSQVVAFALINRGVVLLPTGTAAVLLLLPSVFALPLAAMLLGEVPSWTQIVGCVVILAGAAYAVRPRPRPQ